MNEADEEHHVAKVLIAELEEMDGRESLRRKTHRISGERPPPYQGRGERGVSESEGLDRGFRGVEQGDVEAQRDVTHPRRSARSRGGYGRRPPRQGRLASSSSTETQISHAEKTHGEITVIHPMTAPRRNAEHTNTWGGALAFGIIATLYAREIFVPLALALTAWVLASQLFDVANQLPRYRQNIHAKIQAMRNPGKRPLGRAAQSVKVRGACDFPAILANCAAEKCTKSSGASSARAGSPKRDQQVERSSRPRRAIPCTARAHRDCDHLHNLHANEAWADSVHPENSRIEKLSIDAGRWLGLADRIVFATQPVEEAVELFEQSMIPFEVC
jgi:hypothetical protein